MLPDQPKLETHIYASSAAEDFTDWQLLTIIDNSSTEPVYDVNRLQEYNVLSVFHRQGGPYPDRQVQVWDFYLDF